MYSVLKTTTLANWGDFFCCWIIAYNKYVFIGVRYFAVEPYAATLEQICNRQYAGPMPSDAQVLSQIAKGINFLHTKGFAHGNLNPQTVLISQSQPVRMKVAEFGLRKTLVECCHSPDNENSTGTKQNSIKKGRGMFSLLLVDSVE